MEITRRQIIKALQTEPLRSGSFAYYNSPSLTSDQITDVSDKECKVCAVGAVLRSRLKDTTISEFNQILRKRLIRGSGGFSCSSNATEEDINNNLRERRFLSALSGKFETLCDELGYDQRPLRANSKIRGLMIDWVKENLPIRFEVDI